ncbi:MAG TPA: hypothetical protein VGI99_10400, partial [Gemmataceae bacterium]
MLRLALLAIGVVATVMGAAVGDDAPTAPAPREKPDRQLKDVPPIPMLGPGGPQPNLLMTPQIRSLQQFDFK